ncbi:hypothetical protein SH591_07500 [Sphingomonas sp. LY54]|uniref:hypothetical protein n=1 Tax=Sphingomonas sp. LY54 TaxID=3095343 RepID=UPI002D770611|nr:hypothetical protein [Sphingomonas sp. LY54]WRP30007.1 hypothetical protein SH591_07500 [Sphingomonas sp. LY54]
MHCDSDQIADLIAAAEIEPTHFFRHVDFTGVDLRGQDLSPFDVSRVSFDGAICDSTTLIGGNKRPITDRLAFELGALRAIDEAGPMFDLTRLQRDILALFSSSVPFGLFIASFEDMRSFVADIFQSSDDVGTLAVNRGYIRRQVLFWALPENTRNLRVALKHMLAKEFPGIFPSSARPLAQLELKLDRTSDKLARPKVDTLREYLQLTRRIAGVTDIWILVRGNDIAKHLGDIRSIISEHSRVHFFVAVDKDERIPSLGILDVSPRLSFKRISLSEYSRRGVRGHLDDVEDKTGRCVRFTPAFRKGAERFENWDSVKGRIRSIVAEELESLTVSPLVVGKRLLGRL